MNSGTFDIIYIPDTVSYQSLALLSLLQNTRYNFRLIGNALSAEEYALMQSICEFSERLTCVNFASRHIIPHGTVVNLLHACTDDPLLCFMDSDVFIFEPLKESPAELLGDHAVFSSGSRIENDGDAVYAGFRGGAGTVSPDGQIPLATTFFCIYQQAAVAECLQHYGVGFEQYRSWQQIPPAAQREISRLKLEFDMFDTGKLMSVLLHQMNHRKRFSMIEGLVHVGGMSGRYLQDIDLTRRIRIEDETESADADEARNQHGHLTRTARDIQVKRLLGRYFYIYLNHLIGRSNPPELISDDPVVMSTVDTLRQNIDSVVDKAAQDSTQQAILEHIRQHAAGLADPVDS